MESMKKHTDTVIIIGAIITSMLWMNGKFNDVDKQFSVIEKDIATIKAVFEKDIAVIKAVLLMKQILPPELAKVEAEK